MHMCHAKEHYSECLFRSHYGTYLGIRKGVLEAIQEPTSKELWKDINIS